MKKTLIILVIFAGIIAAGWLVYSKKAIKDIKVSLPEKITIKASYICDQGKTIEAVFYPGKESAAEISLSDGRKLALKQGISGSGARYVNSDESFVFWIKGGGAVVQENGKETFSKCRER